MSDHSAANFYESVQCKHCGARQQIELQRDFTAGMVASMQRNWQCSHCGKRQSEEA